VDRPESYAGWPSGQTIPKGKSYYFQSLTIYVTISLTLKIKLYQKLVDSDIVFDSSKLKKECNDRTLLIRNYGSENARKIGQRLDDLKAASNLAEVRTFPRADCHELTGDRKGQLALSLKHPFRLIIEPANDPIPQKAEGGLDWGKVTAVRIIEVVDYHGK